MPILPVIFGIAFALVVQDAHHALNQRGSAVMGFDHEKTVHHFYLYPDGGAIDIAVTHPPDADNVAAIRSHLPHISKMFGAGNFEAPMLVHDSKTVPGTATLAARKELVRYHYAETPAGGRVDILTSDPEALAALHDFLKYQIAEHRTGDSGQVVPRP